MNWKGKKNYIMSLENVPQAQDWNLHVKMAHCVLKPCLYGSSDLANPYFKSILKLKLEVKKKNNYIKKQIS